MDYEELIEKAMKGRKILPVATEWGMNDMTLRRYVKGERMPDFDTALKLVKEAGIDAAEGFEILAEEERKRRAPAVKKPTLHKQQGFVQIDLFAFIFGGVVAQLLYYVK